MYEMCSPIVCCSFSALLRPSATMDGMSGSHMEYWSVTHTVALLRNMLVLVHYTFPSSVHQSTNLIRHCQRRTWFPRLLMTLWTWTRSVVPTCFRSQVSGSSIRRRFEEPRKPPLALAIKGVPQERDLDDLFTFQGSTDTVHLPLIFPF